MGCGVAANQDIKSMSLGFSILISELKEKHLTEWRSYRLAMLRKGFNLAGDKSYVGTTRAQLFVGVGV